MGERVRVQGNLISFLLPLISWAIDNRLTHNKRMRRLGLKARGLRVRQPTAPRRGQPLAVMAKTRPGNLSIQA